jgi:phosphoribosyl 1,2-cyclic phosphodiesterase
MSLELCVLGSGSSGNSTVVRAAEGAAFLIDAGFGPRATEQRLYGTGLSVADLSAIVLTHLDSDHFNFYWLLTLLKHGIRVHVARRHARQFLHAPEVRDLRLKLAHKNLPPDGFDRLVTPFDDALSPIPGVHIEALPLAHDEAGSHGFVITCGDYRVGYATDLGRVPEELIARFCGADVIALESNYDPCMEETSGRPPQLKRLIMGGSGHLSNEQAFAAVQAILDRTAATCGPDHLPRHIVLLHRSRQCNCPKLVRTLFAGDPRVAPVLTLADQHERTPWLHARRPRAQRVEQLALAWG